MATPIDVVVFKCRKIFPTGIRQNRALFTGEKLILVASQTVNTARNTPKIRKGQPPTFGSHCSRFHPSWFTFGEVIAERVKAVL